MKKYEFRRVRWSLKATMHLKLTMSNDPAVNLDWLKMQVERERFVLAGVYQDRERIGSVVLDVDGRDMVVVAAGGSGTRLYHDIAPSLRKLAEMWGCSAIRVHAQTLAVDRLLRSVGFGWAETIRRMAV